MKYSFSFAELERIRATQIHPKEIEFYKQNIA